MSSIFSRIVSGEIPSYKIAENDNYLAFLDVFPLTYGHVLVVPKQETDKFYDLSDELLAGLITFAKPIAKAIEQAFPCNRCGMSIIGIEVPHTHIHLLPINNADDINFTKPKLKLTQEEFLEMQQKIKSKLY